MLGKTMALAGEDSCTSTYVLSDSSHLIESTLVDLGVMLRLSS